MKEIVENCEEKGRENQIIGIKKNRVFHSNDALYKYADITHTRKREKERY